MNSLANSLLCCGLWKCFEIATAHSHLKYYDCLYRTVHLILLMTCAEVGSMSIMYVFLTTAFNLLLSLEFISVWLIITHYKMISQPVECSLYLQHRIELIKRNSVCCSVWSYTVAHDDNDDNYHDEFQTKRDYNRFVSLAKTSLQQPRWTDENPGQGNSTHFYRACKHLSPKS